MTGPLDAAWDWYLGVRETAAAARRIAHLWDSLTDAVVPPDERARLPSGEQLDAAAGTALQAVEQIAVLHLFATFEAMLRDHVLAQIESERTAFTPAHPLLVNAMASLDRRVDQGNISELLDSYAAGADIKLRELLADVREVREYRNWVAHGSRGVPPIGSGMTAQVAKDRLEDFLFAIRATPPT